MEASEYQAMRSAETRHWWYLGLHDLILKSVRAEARRSPSPLEILDAGCGTGRLAQLLAPFGHVSACDLHPLALEATRQRQVARVFRADVSAPQSELGREAYDLITCIDVLYHRSVPHDFIALRNLRAALRPGGLLLVHVAAFESLRGRHDAAVHTRHRYRTAEISARLAIAGFRERRVSYRLLPLFVPMLLWRRFGRHRAAGDPAESDTAALPPRLLNGLLAACVKAENRLVTSGLSLPFGTSVFATARK